MEGTFSLSRASSQHAYYLLSTRAYVGVNTIVVQVLQFAELRSDTLTYALRVTRFAPKTD